MDDAIIYFVGAGGLFIVGVVILLVVAVSVNPKWFGRSFASTFGGFVGATAAMVAVVVVVGICVVVGCVVIVFLVGQSVPVG